MRFLGVILVAGLSIVLSGCAAALVEGGLVEASLARAVPMGIAEAGAMTLRAGAVEAGAMSTRAAVSAAGASEFAGAVRMAGVGRIAGAALTEARLATIARGAGLPGVLEEMTVARSLPRIDALGQITFEGRTILSAEGGVVRLPSSGRIIGHLRGTQIYSVDSAGAAGAEIGELYSPSGRISGETTMQVTRIRPGWYRVTLGSQSTTVSELALAGLVAGSQRREKRDEVAPVDSLLHMAAVAGEQRRRIPSRKQTDNLDHEAARLQAQIDSVLSGRQE
ncbi:MAG: hypothetical protein ABL967_09040 [Bryobacteraceae bacterium]